MLTLLAVFLRIADWAKRIERDRPAAPIQELPRIEGRWEDSRGYIVIAHDFQKIDGHDAFENFEKSDGGPPEKGLLVAWNSLEVPLPWQKVEYIMYTLQDRAIKRREKITCEHNATTLKTRDEQGRERVYQRKP